MSSDPPELGKGLFGYRKSAVNQILADRDLMLRQAEGRVRSAESKVGELEKELGAMKARNTRMDEQLDRLRAQLDALSRRTEAAFLEREEAPVIEEESPSGAFQEELQPTPGFGAEVPEEAGEEEDLSYGFELGGQPTEVQEYEPSLAEGPDAVTGEYEAAAAEPSSYWGGEGQGPDVQMETGPGYAEAEPRQDEAADLPTAGGYESPEFAYGGEQALPSAEQYQDEVDDLAYGAEITAAETEQEADAFAPATSGYEPSGYGAGGMEAAGYEAPGYESAGAYEPPAYEMADESEAAGVYEAVSEAPSEPEAEPQPVRGPYPHAFPEEHRPADETPVSAEPHRPPAASESSEITSRFVTEEIAGVLSAAEESAGRILERARVQSEQQINKSSHLWEEVRAEVARLATWREGIEPVIQTVMTKVEGIRTQIEDVPERIREALAPMADSISGIDADLAELAEACSPPLLLAPSELESDEGDMEWPGSDEDQPVNGEPPGRLNAG